MSRTAVAMRENGRSWEYIAEQLRFITPEAARWSASRAWEAVEGRRGDRRPDWFMAR